MIGVIVIKSDRAFAVGDRFESSDELKFKDQVVEGGKLSYTVPIRRAEYQFNGPIQGN